MVDVRRLKMLQMVQLFKCEEDALQVGHIGTSSSTSLLGQILIAGFVSTSGS